METRYDFIQIKADVSPEGWIRDNPVITRAGIFAYQRPDGSIRKEFRSDDEVFSESSLRSIAGIPITDGHHGLITKENPKAIIGTVISPGARSEQDVTAEIIIHDANKLGKKRELSLGYQCVLDETPGEFNGVKYDCIQKNIRYNHLAVVNKGRAGNARLRLDSADAVNGSFEMETNNMEPKLVNIRLDNIDYQAAPEVSNAYTKSLEANVSLQKRFDALEAERDNLKSKVDGHEKDIAKVKDTVREEFKARLAVEQVAAQYELKLDDADTIVDIKKKVIAKLKPTLVLENRSDEYIASAYDLVVEEDKDKNKKLSNQRQRMDGNNNTSNNNDKPKGAEAARATMIANLRNRHSQQLDSKQSA